MRAAPIWRIATDGNCCGAFRRAAAIRTSSPVRVSPWGELTAGWLVADQAATPTASNRRGTVGVSFHRTAATVRMDVLITPHGNGSVFRSAPISSTTPVALCNEVAARDDITLNLDRQLQHEDSEFSGV